MKKLLVLLLACLPAFAVGTVVQTVSPIGTQPSTGPDLRVYVLQINWTGDAANGSVPSTLLNSIVGNFAMQTMRIASVEFQPGTPNPTANYSVTITDASGVDMLAGTGANLSATASSFSSSVVSPPLVGVPTFNLSGNSVNSAKGTVLIYFVPLSMLANARGLPAALGANNTFTGTNTFTNLVTAGSFNGIRIVDGIRFPQTAAGINAADADLGTGIGEIWIPPTSLSGMTATDAQISISKNHTLRVMGRINIDSVNKGPILLATGSKILCNETDTSPIINVGVGTSPSLIRLAVQDGSVTDGLFVEGCLISAGTNAITNGVIDASGSANLAKIRDNYILGFTSGWGVFVQDIQSGALGGTNSLQIMNNHITASSTGGCIEITHSATNAVTLAGISISDLNCTAGAGLATAPIVLQNTSAGLTNLGRISITNATIGGSPAGQPGVNVAGVEQGSFRHIVCNTGTPCINITNSTNNISLTIDNIVTLSGGNTVVDSLNGITAPGAALLHYDTPNNTSTVSYFNGISRAVVANLNNIRIVDGVKFALSAAGINAADADLGSNTGEIWITPSAITATDAQITIGTAHTLRIFSQLQIDASAKGPMLLKSAAKISCMTTGPDTNNGSIINTGTGAAASMVRLFTQDGSQNNNAIEGCNFTHNGVGITNGVIDATGMTGRGWIRDNKIQNFNAGWGIFIQDNQTGALGGTNNVQIMNNQITASNNGTGGCIEITHSSTNNVLLLAFDIQDLNCTSGPSIATAPVLITNASAGQNIRQVNISNATIAAIPGGQPGITLNGVFQAAIKHVSCYSPGSGAAGCVNLPSNAQSGGTTVENVFTFPSSNTTTLVDSNNSVTLSSQGVLGHYSLGPDYLTAVSYLKVNGLAPASCTSLVGFGTGATCAFDAGSTNNAGIMNVTLGTTPAASGSLVLNFNTTQSNFGVNNPTCQWGPTNGSGFWNGRAIIITGGTVSNTTINALWDNNAVSLTTGIVKISYWCAAK